jgi:drug/metabolite transporter (DMT)-like permease
MLWAWALFAEPLTAPMFVGLAVTFLGVWMTSRTHRQEAAPGP